MNYLRAVIVRELKQIFARPLYIFSSVVMMTICVVFFTTLMTSGSPQRMPVAVVDHDQSSISRRLVHEMEATQSVTVVAVVPTFAEARNMMQHGKIYGFMELPENFYADIVAQRRPQIAFYTTQAYTVGGTTAYKQLLTMANLASGAFQREILRMKGMDEKQIMNIIQPIVLEAHLIANPWSNYPIYLLSTILPGILGVIIVMITVFSIGSELKFSTSPQWLKEANGSFAIAIIGKMLPYTLLFLIMGISCNMLLFNFMHFPVYGSHWGLALNMINFVLAEQCVAIFFIGLLPTLRDALSVGALYSMLSFSLSGFTYPKMGMLPFVQALTNAFPLRHYYLNYVNEALMGASFMQCIPQYVAYICFMFLPFLIFKRLHGAMVNLNFPKK
jgi:ABC-2 type transport system permease protein